MGQDALEQALALQRAPFLRQALSARPLPKDVADLVQIASGSPSLLAEAVRRSGEGEQKVLEAARFYLQEVLFFPAADAYRVLGVARDAPAEQIKTHYRLLQRWLHPDREDGDRTSVHAVRVNQAWNELRSPERRSDYDARQPAAAPSPGPVAIAPAPRVVMTPWQPRDLGERLRQALPLAILVAGCLQLAIMAIWQLQRDPPKWDASADRPDEALPETTAQRAEPWQSVAEAPGTARVLASQPRPMGQGRRDREPPVPGVTSVAERDAKARSDSLPSQSTAPRLVAPAVTARPGDSVGELDAVKNASLRDAIATSEIAATPTRSQPVRVPDRVRQVAGRVRDTTPAPLETNGSGVAERSVTPDTPKSEVTLAQVVAAQQRAQQVVAYLAARDAHIPPVWNDLRTQELAQRMRNALSGRNVGGAGRELSLTAPAWNVAADRATLDSGYRFANTGNANETGRLRMTMVWREGRWLVSRVSVDPASP